MKIAYNKSMTLLVGMRSAKRSVLAVVAVLLFCLQFSWLMTPDASAAQLQQRALRISSPKANELTTHKFTFRYITTTDPIGSIKFEYCTSPIASLPCDEPPGIDASGAVFSDQTGETGYSLFSAQTNSIVLTRGTAQSVNNTTSDYTFDSVVNPDGVPSKTFYVRIATYQSTDATGTETDWGSVVNSITEGVDVSGEVPPILSFCVGLTIDTDCSSAEGNLIDLGDLKTNTVSSGTSQMRAATNAQFGLAIGVYGTTMTSGINEIPALNNPTPSAPGNAQFGFNLRSNSNPGKGEEPAGPGITTPTASYNIPNRYTFNSGDIVAISSEETDVRKFTSTYIVNVSPSQQPGVYTSTLTYICTATF